jgi:HK97 family phage portal protein
MGIISDIKEKRAMSLSQFDNWLDVLISGVKSKTGATVNEQKAMRLSSVFACVRIISEDVASLPLNVYEEREDNGRRKAKNNYLYPLLHKKPNNIMTSFTWREVMMAHLLLWGNHYSQVITDRTGKIAGLWPLHPARVQPIIKNRKLYYKYKKEDNTKKVFEPYEILHIPGLGFDGLQGISVISYNREAVGLGLGAEEFGARFFENGAHPSGIIEYPEGLKDNARKRLKEDLKAKHAGLGKSHNLMVFEHGMKFHQISIPPNDAQFLETRQFQVREIARIYRVPPHMLADMEKGASFKSIEQQSIDYVVKTLRPWLVRIEQVLNDKLISSRNSKNYIEFNVEGLLRGDSQARSEYYKNMFEVGAMSPNDILEKENRNPVEGGDQRFVPLNFIPLNESNPRLDEEENNGRAKNKRHEMRARRSAAKRTNIRERYKRLIKKSVEKIVNSETKAIRGLIDNELRSEKRSTQDFRDKIVEFYEDFAGEVREELEPVLRSLADAIVEEAADEINLDDYSIDDFFEDYMEAMSGGYAGYSRGQLLALMNEADEKDEEPAELIEERLEEWEERKPGKIAEKHSVKLEGAIARTVFATGGVTKLIWVASSGACPICKEMDGTVVGIEESFMEPSDKINADNKDFSPGGSITHAPLHEGCECTISPQ